MTDKLLSNWRSNKKTWTKMTLQKRKEWRRKNREKEGKKRKNIGKDWRNEKEKNKLKVIRMKEKK